MITLFSGTPGSGKSLRVAKDVLENIRFKKRNVICVNMTVNSDYAIRSSKDGKLMFCPTYEHIVNPQPFYSYAEKYHVLGKEDQTLLVFDEVQDLLSVSVCKVRKQRYPDYLSDWRSFFSQHRHLGYEIYFITQYDRMIHPEIRYLIEYEFVHRKFKNAGDTAFFISLVIRLLTGYELFIQIRKWKPNRERLGTSFYTYSKKCQKLYDSYKKFRDFQQGNGFQIPAFQCNSVNFIEQRMILEQQTNVQ